MKGCYALHGLVCLLTSLAAISLGVHAAFGYDVWALSFFAEHATVLKVTQIVLGVAGVIELLWVVIACKSSGSSCQQ
jgi:uncharacterized membrane protein YuzA (DUF378 family)